MTIDAWLEELGLGQYAPIFAANAIDFDILPDLTEGDFEKLGLLLGHRKKLLRAIKERGTAAAPPISALPPRSQPPAPPAPPVSADAERRQITVLFSDLVGSTSLSQNIDPEILRDMLGAYQAMATAAIKNAGGMLAKFLGDGVLAYFGYPNANDDDAIRAVRAARAMIAGIAVLNEQWQAKLGRALEARVGIHTGLVVVGDMGSGDARESNAIVGETPNLAARVQGLAAPGTVAISGATWRLARRAFVCRALGVQQAKGVADGIEVHLVEAEILADDALEITGNDIPQVGRDTEIALLLDRLRRARAGNGHAVLIGGEAGLGKSRLMRAFHEASGLDADDILVLRCTPQYRNSAFYPIINLLEHRLGFGADDNPAARRAKLDSQLSLLAIARPEISRPLAELLGVATDTEQLSEEQRRRRLLGALRQFVVAETAARPRAVIVEDTHWIDASTLEFLGLLLTPLAELPLFLVITFRPEFVPPWPIASHVTALALSRLTRDQVAEIAHHRAGRELPASVLDDLLNKTDGIPLFAEELTQSVIASGAIEERDGRYELTTHGAAMAIPSSLRDSLTARLDRLSGARGVAQIAATIGREFPYALLAAVADRDADSLESDLDALIRADILRQRGVPPQATYSFKHALLQDAAYEVLLRTTRQQYHARIADAYERMFPAEVESFPEIIAHHFSNAGMDGRAFDYYVRAGDQARRRSGLREAMAHFRAALGCLSHLPESPDRDRAEIETLLKLGPLIATAEAVSGGPYREAYDRAHALAVKLGDDRRRFAATWGLWFLDAIDASADSVRRRTTRIDEMFAVARKLGDPDLELEAYHSRWATRFAAGDLRAAASDTEVGLARYDRTRHAHHRFTYGGHDTGVCARGFAGICAGIAGEPDRSASLLAAGLDLGRSFGDPPMVTHAALMAAIGAQVRGDIEMCRAIAEETLELSKTHNVAQFSPVVIAIGAWAHWAAGDRARSDELLAASRRLAGRTPVFGMFGTCLLALLSDKESETDASGALARLKNAVTESNVTGFFHAELIRRIGALTLRVDPAARDEAAAHFRAAIEVAARQNARAFELRATLALARLLATDRRTEEANALLAPVVATFPDAVFLPDLPEARAFLAGLR